MSIIIDKALEASRDYAQNYNPMLGKVRPSDRSCNPYGSTALPLKLNAARTETALAL
jgi:hypothetical protein